MAAAPSVDSYYVTILLNTMLNVVYQQSVQSSLSEVDLLLAPGKKKYRSCKQTTEKRNYLNTHIRAIVYISISMALAGSSLWLGRPP